MDIVFRGYPLATGGNDLVPTVCAVGRLAIPVLRAQTVAAGRCTASGLDCWTSYR